MWCAMLCYAFASRSGGCTIAATMPGKQHWGSDNCLRATHGQPASICLLVPCWLACAGFVGRRVWYSVNLHPPPHHKQGSLA